MQRIRRGNQHSIDIWRTAQLRRRIEGQRNLKLSSRFSCLRHLTAGQRSHLTFFRQGKTRHQALDSMKSEANDAEANHFYFVSANERGATLTCSVLPVVARVPSLLTVNSVMELDCSLMTKTNFASGSTTIDSGFVPVPATEVVNAVSAPVEVSSLNCERFADAEFTTYTNTPVVSVAAATGEVPVSNRPGPESRLPSD